MLEALTHAFAQQFGRGPEFGVRAPGRVNLIGEHTDYSEGLVFPCAIDRDTLVVAARRTDALLRVFSLEQPAAGVVTLPLTALARRGDWLDYVQAPAFALAERGVALVGADLGIASRVPLGSGLSSSAALGVALAFVYAWAAGATLSPRELADAAHRGENHFVGVGCGILDPYASALGRRGHALRIDCRDRSVSARPLAKGIALLVANSRVSRELAHGGYRARVAECAAALAAAKAAGIAPPGARTLRDLTPADLPALERALSGAPLRRARHVIRENARVDAFAAALARGDLAQAGALLREGQASLRDDYEVSLPELDALCALGDAVPGCFGSRITGAGWGGCTLHLVAQDAADEVARALTAGYTARFGKDPQVLIAHAADGASALEL